MYIETHRACFEDNV